MNMETSCQTVLYRRDCSCDLITLLEAQNMTQLWLMLSEERNAIPLKL